ncbi:MAG: hypothetical protein ACD_56C00036G0012 [uncultured bacterium]|nr:MAG: hypothetical protein ACD_56C00036G0012 [uncultured bacterium]
MKAKKFNSYVENGMEISGFCVDGKVHFTKYTGLGNNFCDHFRPCDGTCQKHEYEVPENVANLVTHYTRNNFTGDKFNANAIGEIRNACNYEPWDKRTFNESYPRWTENWKLVE